MFLDRYRRPRLVILHPRSTAYDAARAMAEHRVGSVLVGDGDELVGVVTDRDLALDVIAGGLDPHATVLRDLMSEPLVTIDVGESISAAAKVMREHGCRRLPLLEDGKPVGIVTFDDLVLDGDLSPAEARGVLIAQIDRAFPARGPGRVDEGPRARAEARRRARAEATFSRLLRAIERDSVIRERSVAERALGIVLGAVCRRLTPQEARHFIAQLPSKLHEELNGCLDGPDKRITTLTIQNELVRRLDLDPRAAADALFAICEAVADGISAGEIAAVRGQLPAGMKELFPEFPYRRAG